MAVIKKKIWPEFFRKILKGKKKAEIRLADFNLKKGDILVLEEYNPAKKYTGRSIKMKVKRLNKIDIAKIYSLDKIKKFGLYLIELN